MLAEIRKAATDAIHFAVQLESGEIKERLQLAVEGPVQQLLSAGVAMRQNVKDANRLMLATVFVMGTALGLGPGYMGVLRTQNEMNDRLDRIGQMVAPQAQPAPAPVAAPQVPAHKGRGKWFSDENLFLWMTENRIPRNGTACRRPGFISQIA